MRADLAGLLRPREGHFELESGHHGQLWLDLEALCLRPSVVRVLAGELAERIRDYAPDIVCGPLVEGAFVGLLAAERLDIEFVYSAAQPRDPTAELFPVRYRIPSSLRKLRNRRVAIVNDVINAGSAVRGTIEDLRACGANPVAIGTLLTLGTHPLRLAAEAALPLETLAAEANTIWLPSECPPCALGVPLTEFPI